MTRLAVTLPIIVVLFGGLFIEPSLAGPPETLQGIADLGTPIKGKTLEKTRGEGLGNVNPAALSSLSNGGNLGLTQINAYNSIGGNAFKNSQGVMNIIQNSGNNVNISSAINMHLNFVK